MKNGYLLLLITVFSVMTFMTPQSSFALVEGDLSCFIFSENSIWGVVAPSDTITYYVYGMWDRSDPAPNVVMTFKPSPMLNIISISPSPSSQSSDSMIWNLGTVDYTNYMTYIEIIATLKPEVTLGSYIICSASITGEVTDTDQSNNSSYSDIQVSNKGPDLYIFNWGSMEPLFDESGLYFCGEQGMTQEFTLSYWNMGLGEATDVSLTYSLPEGFSFVSSDPAPTRTDGNQLIWDLGTLETWYYGEIKVRAVPNESGIFTIHAAITTTAPESGFQGSDYPNESDYQLKIIPLFPPIVTNPASYNGLYDFGFGTFTVATNPKIEGLAKSGSTVYMYEGPEFHFGNDLSDLTLIGTTVAGNNRVWTVQPTQLTETGDYHLYFRAELDDKTSSVSMPLTLSVNTALADAGFDMDGYSVETGDNKSSPGGLGGKTGSIPGEDIIITLRMTAPDEVESDSTLWKFHNLKATVEDEGNSTEVEIPPSSVKYAGKDSDQCFKSWDFTYILSGYGPGARVTVKYHPFKYACGTGIPEEIIGDDITITEILIDPAGYVYDRDIAGSDYEWPEIPPAESLIDKAAVTAWERTGDEEWTMWDAAAHGDQVNPQITDTTTEDKVKEKGYFAFFVPTGQYRVTATAPEYADAESPILTVINEPIYYNLAMHRSTSYETSVAHNGASYELPKVFTLLRNYPNPFNPTTTILFMLPVKGFAVLTIYNLQGQKVRELLSQDMPAGLHNVIWDGLDSSGRQVSSGVYISSLSSGRMRASGKMLLVR